MSWVPIFQGSHAQALAIQASLGAGDIPTRFANSILGGVAPYSMKSTPDVMLLAPADRLEEIREILQLRPDGPVIIQPNWRTFPDAAGRRVRWMSLSLVGAPMALVEGIRYLRNTRGIEPKPEHHALTLAAMGFAVVGICGWIAIFILLNNPLGWRSFIFPRRG